jgi:acyl-coenzyme A synthetase/AMP-(fatty) acid ligase
MLALRDTGPPEPPPEPFNMAAHVLDAGRTTPDRIALAVLGLGGAERWSYARLTAAVLGTATGLLNRGLVPGDRVLMRLDNTVDFPVAYLGAIAAGLVPVPSSAQWTPREATAAAEIVGPSAILAAPGVALPAGTAAPVVPLEELRGWRALPPASPQMGAPDRPAYIVFTSGTSSRPRAVLHAHRALWARRMMHRGWYGLTEADRLLHAGAFNWTFTLGTGLLDPWSVGATALVPAPGTPIEALPLLLKRHDATLFAAAPGVVRRLLRQAPALPLPRLRHGLVAGETCPEPLRAAWRRATGTELHEAYGLSECSTFLSACPDAPAPPGRLGRPQPGRRVAILGPEGQVLPVGAPGSIAIDRRDPGLMLEYLGAPEATAKRFAGAWFLTGDAGAMDEQGWVTYLGREDDVMTAGGYRVSPLEVEEVLATHPAVEEAAAAEVAVAPGTTVIAAFYTGAETGEAVLAAHCAEQLARYKCPRIFVRLDDLPRGANGKLLRRRLREEFEANR